MPRFDSVVTGYNVSAVGGKDGIRIASSVHVASYHQSGE